MIDGPPLGIRHLEHRLRLGRLGDAGRAVHHEGGADMGLLQQQLGLEQLKLEAHGAQILAQEEIHVLEGELVGRILGLRGGDVAFGRFGILARAREGAARYACFCHFVGL
jgi:hypothetical protein